MAFPALEGLGLGTRSSSARPVSSLWTEPELIKRPHLHPFARVASPFPTASAALAGARDQGLVLDGGLRVVLCLLSGPQSGGPGTAP